MNFVCQYCEKEFTLHGNLLKHQKTTKYCIKIQKNQGENNVDNIDNNMFKCEYCDKEFTTKNNINRHYKTCIEKIKFQVREKDDEISGLNQKLSELSDKLSVYKESIMMLETQNHLLREQVTGNDNKLLETLQEIAVTAIEQKDEVISGMVKKYVKKQPRKKFDCSNVVYILTTQSLKKDRRYILGKAKNLTNRLSTYNKTDEHEVVYYKDCGDEETMSILEPFVFKKLSKYREQANRERFILPDNSNIDLFINTINECFEFLK